jgi:hypothetical protein
MEPVELIRELVYLRVGSQSGLIARIIELEDDRLAITMPIDEEGARVTPKGGSPLEVGWVTKTGIEWHGGVVADEPSDEASVLRVRLLAPRTSKVERRESPRARVTLDCEVSLFGGSPARGRIIDVGSGGIAAIVPLELQPGDSVLLTVLRAGEEPIRLTASCVRTTGEGPAGFTYGLFSAGTRDLLVEHAFRRAAEAA